MQSKATDRSTMGLTAVSMRRDWIAAGRVWPAVVAGLLAAGVSCGGSQQPSRGADRGTAESEFKRCQDQERYGDAKSCWHAFLDHHGESASAAEQAYAKEHLESPGPALTQPEQSIPTPPMQASNDAVTRAARGALQGMANLQLTEESPSGAAPRGFPSRQVAFDQCYKGFKVSGNSQSDVVELGQRCGAPCGMIPFSGVVSGSQDERDNVDVYSVPLKNDRCYRFFAVGESSISDLDSAIADAEGNVLLRDVFNDAAPILGPKGPFCPPLAGHYKFVVSVASGSGKFHFQVWQGKRI